MKVALVIERMDPRRGGRERSTAQIARNLVAAGCDVDILCYQADWNETGVTVRVLPVDQGSKLQTLSSFASAVADQVHADDYDIVHGTLPIASINVYQPRGGTMPGQRAASLRRRGLVGKVASWLGWQTNPLRRHLARCERALVRCPDVRCLAVSEMVAREFRRYFGRDADVVFNGADAPTISKEMLASIRSHKCMALGVGPDAPVFVTVATNWKLKAVDQVIAAFARFVDTTGRSDARLVCIGRDEPARYALAAQRLGVGGQVDFPGRVEDAFEWYTIASATILLSWYDPCSRVVLESVALGVPAITTRYNGAAEILADGAGIVVDSPRQTGAVADAMVELADANRSRACRASCQRVAERVSMQRHVSELLSLYEEIVTQR